VRASTTYVPARNTIMLSLASAWAEVLSRGTFPSASTRSTTGYPDCRPAFIEPSSAWPTSPPVRRRRQRAEIHRRCCTCPRPRSSGGLRSAWTTPRPSSATRPTSKAVPAACAIPAPRRAGFAAAPAPDPTQTAPVNARRARWRETNFLTFFFAPLE